jgi:hypothetical protein
MTTRAAMATGRPNSLRVAEATKRFRSPHADKAIKNPQDHKVGTTPRKAEAIATCEKSSTTTVMLGTSSTQDAKSVPGVSHLDDSDLFLAFTRTISHHEYPREFKPVDSNYCNATRQPLKSLLVVLKCKILALPILRNKGKLHNLLTHLYQ